MGYAAGVGDVFCIPIQYHKQIAAAGITALAGAEAPCNCRVWRIDANVDVLAGALLAGLCVSLAPWLLRRPDPKSQRLAS